MLDLYSAVLIRLCGQKKRSGGEKGNIRDWAVRWRGLDDRCWVWARGGDRTGSLRVCYPDC